MTESEVAPEKKAPEKKAPEPKRGYGWLSMTIAAGFGLFYAYDVWEAVGNLIGVPKVYDGLGLTAQTPWILLVAALIIPIVVYGLVLLLGLRRNAGERAILLLTGLAVSNALALATVATNSLIFSDLLHRI